MHYHLCADLMESGRFGSANSRLCPWAGSNANKCQQDSRRDTAFLGFMNYIVAFPKRRRRRLHTT